MYRIVIILLCASVAFGGYEDFDSDYTEVDPNNNVALTDTKVEWTNLEGNGGVALVYRDCGAAHFGEDFTHLVEVEFNNMNTNARCYHYMLANEVNSWDVIDGDGQESDDFFGICSLESSGNYYLYIRLIEDGAGHFPSDKDKSIALLQGTTYYLTIARDDDGGTNNTGQYSVEIRTGSHAGSLEDTLVVDANSGEQNDYQYLYALNKDNDGVKQSDGFTQNLDLNEAASGTAVPVFTTTYRRRKNQ